MAKIITPVELREPHDPHKYEGPFGEKPILPAPSLKTSDTITTGDATMMTNPKVLGALIAVFYTVGQIVGVQIAPPDGSGEATLAQVITAAANLAVAGLLWVVVNVLTKKAATADAKAEVAATTTRGLPSDLPK